MARGAVIGIEFDAKVQCECGGGLDIRMIDIDEQAGVITIEVGKCEACAKANHGVGYAEGLEDGKEA